MARSTPGAGGHTKRRRDKLKDTRRKKEGGVMDSGKLDYGMWCGN